MNIKITSAKLEAIKKVMKVKKLTVPEMAKAINISRVTWWRVYNGKQKTLASDVYERLQVEFLLPYLHWTEVITDSPNTPNNKRLSPEKMIDYLQATVEGLNVQAVVMEHEFLKVKEENKQLKSKFDKISNLISKN